MYTLSRRSRWDQAGFRDDLMDVLIVKLDGDVVHDLNIEGNSDALGAAVRLSKQAVVIATATAKAFPTMGESETRNEDDVERSDVNRRTVRLRLPNIHLATMQILDGTNLPWLKRLMLNLEEAGADSLRQQSRQQMRHQVRLILEPTEESDGDTRRPGAGEMRKVGSDVHTGSTARGFIHGTQTFPHGLAQRGLIVHGVRGWEG
jgi:hypothetical protein